jgi:hypothetical protein
MKKDSKLRYYNRRILIWSLAALSFLALMVAVLIFIAANPEDVVLRVLNITSSFLFGTSLGQAVDLIIERHTYKKELK